MSTVACTAHSDPVTASRLFSPFDLGGAVLANRAVVAPMAQYSADREGCVGAWHLMHIGNLAV